MPKPQSVQSQAPKYKKEKVGYIVLGAYSGGEVFSAMGCSIRSGPGLWFLCQYPHPRAEAFASRKAAQHQIEITEERTKRERQIPLRFKIVGIYRSIAK